MPSSTYDTLQPTSRRAWREWLKKHHASASGVWIVYAKKHTRIASLSYNDAVEEALCFGWIDSVVQSIDVDLYKQVFTPRKPKSAWSASNKARVERLMAAGAMAPAGMAAVAVAKKNGQWKTWDAVASHTVPADLRKALDANPAAKKNWPEYTPGMRKAFLYKVTGAKRPETRARRIAEVVDDVARKMSREEMMERAGFRKKKPAGRRRVFRRA